MRTGEYKHIKDAWLKIDQAIEKFDRINLSEIEKKNWNHFIITFNRWKLAHNKILVMHHLKDSIMILSQTNHNLRIHNNLKDINKKILETTQQQRPLFYAAEGDLDKLGILNSNYLEEIANQSKKLSNQRLNILLIFLVSLILCAVFIALVISNHLSNSIINVSDIAKELAKGNLNVDTKSDNKDEIGVLMRSFQEMKESFERTITSIEMMTKEQKLGDLEARCDPAGLPGIYSNLVNNVNESFDIIILPVIESIGLMNEYAQGNFNKQMRTLPGKQVIFTESLNNIRSSVLSLIKDSNMLATAAIEGQLSARADATKHQGDFRKIVEGVQ